VPRKLSNTPQAVKAREDYQKKKAAGLSTSKSAAYQREYRRRRNAAGNPVHADWYARPDVKARLKKQRAEYKACPEVRARLNAWNREYLADPAIYAKHLARVAVTNALRAGKLTRLPCETCGAPKSTAHHESYDRPLDVRWYCRHCHLAEHGGTFKPVTALPTPPADALRLRLARTHNPAPATN
jgi:ribosomal protein L37AE/L43A